MTALTQFFLKIRYRIFALFGGSRKNDHLNQELEQHLELAIANYVSKGFTEREARNEALKEFGNVEFLKEECRDSWGLRVLADLLRDLKFGMRRLKKSPSFTVVAVVSLGIAIGANTAIFSILNTILFKPLPVSHPEELREIHFIGPRLNRVLIHGYTNTLPDGRKRISALSYSVFLQIQEATEEQAAVVGFTGAEGIQANARGELLAMDGLLVSGNFCEGLGVGVILGRTIRPEDDQVGAEPVALLSYSFWQRTFNGDPNVLGELISLNQVGFRVIGVLPREFDGPQHGQEEELYVPLATLPIIQPGENLANEKNWWIRVMARLKNGSTNEQLKTALDLALVRSISSDRFESGERARNRVTNTKRPQGGPDNKRVLLRDETDRYKDIMRSILLDGSAGSSNRGEQAAAPFVFMMGAAGIVLLAACANLAGLLIARSVSEEHETATRKALGAGSLRLIRQGLTESLLLAALGAGLGWILSIWGRAAILRALGSVSQAEGLNGDSDVRVFLFVTLIAVMAAFLFGILPSLRSFRINLMNALRNRSDSTGGWLTGRIFVALQVGLALVLIVGAGLLVRSYSNIQKINPGFNMDKLLVFQLNAQNGFYKGDQMLDLYQRSMESVRAIPGVKSVSHSDRRLLAGFSKKTPIVTAPDNPDFEGDHVYALNVSEDFFHTLEISLLSGRVFEAADGQGSERVVVVNESFARTFFGARNPVDKQVKLGANSFYRIVGVCSDTKYNNIKDNPQPLLFFPIKQFRTVGPFAIRTACFQVKTKLDPLALVPAVRKAIAEIDPNLPLDGVKTQAIQMDESIFRERFQAVLLVVFALLGVFLSCIGTYGLMAYTVSRRTSEIGIRKALGAGSNEAIRPILRSSLMVAGIGLGVGAIVVVPLGGLIREQLYRVEPHDPLILSVAIVLLLAASAAAAWFPARKAAKVSPMEALRVE